MKNILVIFDNCSQVRQSLQPRDRDTINRSIRHNRLGILTYPPQNPLIHQKIEGIIPQSPKSSLTFRNIGTCLSCHNLSKRFPFRRIQQIIKNRPNTFLMQFPVLNYSLQLPSRFLPKAIAYVMPINGCMHSGIFILIGKNNWK